MLTFLTSVEYFKVIWPDLEWLRDNLESRIHDPQLTSTAFAELPFVKRPSKTIEIQDIHENKPIDLSTEVVNMTNRIAQTAPGTHRLVEAFNYDLGPFILFMHFVLCCLHRRRDLESIEEWMNELPFCDNRQEMPTENGAAAKAMKRLEVITKNVESRLLHDLRSSLEEIPHYNPKPDLVVRVERDNLLRLRDTQADEIKRLTVELEGLNVRQQETLNDLNARIDEVKRLTAMHQEKSAEHERLTAMYKELSAQFDRLKDSHDQVVSVVNAALKRTDEPYFFRYSQALKDIQGLLTDTLEKAKNPYLPVVVETTNVPGVTPQERAE